MKEQEIALKELTQIVEKEMPKESNLKEKWHEIKNLLYNLNREPYIDDQVR